VEERKKSTLTNLATHRERGKKKDARFHYRSREGKADYDFIPVTVITGREMKETSGPESSLRPEKGKKKKKTTQSKGCSLAEQLPMRRG